MPVMYDMGAVFLPPVRGFFLNSRDCRNDPALARRCAAEAAAVTLGAGPRSATSLTPDTGGLDDRSTSCCLSATK